MHVVCSPCPVSCATQAVLRECVWGQLLPALADCHHMSETSSSEEVAADELGVDKGEWDL